MRSLLTLVSALMLAVLAWTSMAAQAADALQCIEVGADSAGHFEGDRDQVPSDSDKGAPHHHGGCSGHHVGVPTTANSIPLSVVEESRPPLRRKFGLPSLEPDRALRPPIA